MHSSRDIAAAHAFHRQRLVAALVSSHRDDAREQPPRTLRCVVAGLLASAVCAAGIGVSSAVSGHPAISWVQKGLRLAP